MKIEVTQPTLEGFFNDFYAIPAFQREYVWKAEQVTTLLEDVREALYDERGMSIDSEYFIGSVVVYPDKDKVYQLIDGQQRTTSLFIILCALRDGLRAVNSNSDISDLEALIQVRRRDAHTAQLRSKFRVTPLYADAGQTLEAIGSAAANMTAYDKATPQSAQNMIRAYEAAREFFADFSNDELQLSRFFSALTQRVRLVRIETPSVADALRIFETINDRGVGLNSMDLLKNLLFMKASKSDYDVLTAIWKEMVRTIEDDPIKEKPLRFLRYYIISRYADARRAAKPLTEDDLYKWLEDNKSRPDVGIDINPLHFAKTLLTAAKAYAQWVKNPPPALANINRLSARARQHFVVMLASEGLETQELRLLTQRLESLFVAYVLAKEPTKALDLVFANAAPKLRELIAQNENKPSDTRLHALAEFLDSWMLPELHKLRPRLNEALQRLSLDRKTMTRFVLARLCMHLDELARVPTSEIDRYWRFQIEHILPNTPTPEQRAAFDKMDAYDECKQYLGNLVLLEESINATIGRDYFKEKQPHYQKSTLLMTQALAGSQSLGGNNAWSKMAGKLSPFKQWDSTSIATRHRELISLCNEVWQFDR
jgi:hypothetical protein